MPVAASRRKTSWYGIPFRVLFVTVLLTLLSFALGLLLGILGILLLAKTRHVAPDMRSAYRSVAFPAAMVVGGFAFVSSLTIEIRRYRRTKALARIEDQVLN